MFGILHGAPHRTGFHLLRDVANGLITCRNCGQYSIIVGRVGNQGMMTRLALRLAIWLNYDVGQFSRLIGSKGNRLVLDTLGSIVAGGRGDGRPTKKVAC